MDNTLIDKAKKEIIEAQEKAIINSIKYRLKAIADRQKEIELFEKELVELNTLPYDEAVKKYGLYYPEVR